MLHSSTFEWPAEFAHPTRRRGDADALSTRCASSSSVCEAAPDVQFLAVPRAGSRSLHPRPRPPSPPRRSNGRSGPAPATARRPAPRRRLALDLGWEVAGLYSAPHVARSKPAGRESEPEVGDALPRFLPTMSELSPAERTRLSLGRVRVALHRLTHVFVAGVVDVPTVDAPVAAFDRGDLAQLKAELANLHEQLLCRLHVVDPNLGKSYDLGRALAYTCQRPPNWAEVRAQFQRFRLATLTSWLADLSTYLPNHACRAVAISLGIWQEAVPDPDQRAHAGQLALDSDKEAERRLLRELRRQGGIWRSVLGAAKDPREMLGAGDYVAALGRWQSVCFACCSRGAPTFWFRLCSRLGASRSTSSSVRVARRSTRSLGQSPPARARWESL